MGTVWLGARSDGMINRPAALKLPRGNWRRAALASVELFDPAIKAMDPYQVALKARGAVEPLLV
jgi:hypothetical protein